MIIIRVTTEVSVLTPVCCRVASLNCWRHVAAMSLSVELVTTAELASLAHLLPGLSSVCLCLVFPLCFNLAYRGITHKPGRLL